jgi:hypothetical protein
MFSESKEYGDYEIQVTEYAGGYQAAVHPRKQEVKSIDWETKMIWSRDVMGAFALAEQRINEALAV